MFTDLRKPIPSRLVTRVRDAVLANAVRRCLSAVSIIVLVGSGAAPAAHADALAQGTAAYSRGDYLRAAREPVTSGSARKRQGTRPAGFLYEHGFGEPQDYDVAADFYARGAVQGNPFAQAMLGLMYDKGHGVPLDFILAYKWLNLAAAGSQGLDQDNFARLRDALASKMSKDEIAAGQRLAIDWIAVSFDPKLKADRGPWKSLQPFGIVSRRSANNKALIDGCAAERSHSIKCAAIQSSKPDRRKTHADTAPPRTVAPRGNGSRPFKRRGAAGLTSPVCIRRSGFAGTR